MQICKIVSQNMDYHDLFFISYNFVDKVQPIFVFEIHFYYFTYSSIEEKNDRRLYCPLLSPTNRWFLLFNEINVLEILNLTLVLISSFKNANIHLDVSLILTTIIPLILISPLFSSSIKYKLSRKTTNKTYVWMLLSDLQKQKTKHIRILYSFTCLSRMEIK